MNKSEADKKYIGYREKLRRANQKIIYLKKQLNNSIPKEKVEEKIKGLNDNKLYLSTFDDWTNKEYTNEDISRNCIEVLQELLEDK